MTTETQNLAQLEKRLAELKAELDRQRRSLRAKQTTVAVVLVILVAAVGTYLFIVNKKLDEYLSADALVHIAMDKAKPQIKEKVSTLALQAKDKRGDMVKHASQFLKNDAPKFVFEQAMGTLRGVYGKQLASAESQINDAIDAGVVTAKETLKERGVDISKPDEFDNSAEKVADIFAKESEKRIDDFYKTYTERSESFISILDKLGEGKDLSRREKHYRDLITGVLAVAHKWHEQSEKDAAANPTTAPATAAN